MTPCEFEIRRPGDVIESVTIIVGDSVKRDQLKEGEYLPPGVDEIETGEKETRVTFDQPLHAVTLSAVEGKPSEDPIIRVEGGCQVVTVNNPNFVASGVNLRRGDFVRIRHLQNVKDAKKALSLKERLKNLLRFKK
jgi:hypothetical protein